MLHIKSECHQPSGSLEDFKTDFTLYGSGGNLGHVTNWSCDQLTYHKESSHEI